MNIQHQEMLFFFPWLFRFREVEFGEIPDWPDGDGSGILPEGGNANIVGQFVECAIKFWMQGGALVWWCDNEPLTYEANLFLEKVEFPGDVTKTKVRFKSNHKGKKTMHQGDIKVIKKGVFNNKRKF